MLTTVSNKGGTKYKTYLVEELLEGPHLLGVDFKEAGQDWCEMFLDTWLEKLVSKYLKVNW